jgi:4-oxalocrotonate tautomerase
MAALGRRRIEVGRARRVKDNRAPADASASEADRTSHEGDPMPTLRVELMEGRTVEQKKALVTALTKAVVETLGTKPEAVDILLFDIKRHDWATGGELWSEKKPG